ncbi:MAG: hypothetical protein ACR2KT_15525 [Methylocella sp.]
MQGYLWRWAQDENSNETTGAPEAKWSATHGRILPLRTEHPGRRLRTWPAQDDEVLLRVAERAARHVLDELPAVREAIAHKRGRVEGRAEVRACDLRPAHDALAVRELCASSSAKSMA